MGAVVRLGGGLCYEYCHPWGDLVLASVFYDLVSGRSRGPGAMLVRTALATLEPVYRLGVGWRNRRYDTRPELTQQVGVPVISIGNLTLGGTGKTPMVKWVVRQLREEGVRVAIVSRGYGATSEKGTNDEAMELEQSLPEVPHLQNPDRVAAAQAAIEERAAQAIVIDDGFQHRRLGRDLDVVLLDATAPFGFGHLFPRGSLREPIGSLKRADIVCLTRAELISESERLAIREQVARVAPEALWCESTTEPVGLLGVNEVGSNQQDTNQLHANEGGTRERDTSERAEPLPMEPIDLLENARVGLFSGIGNPAAFRQLVESLGAQVVFNREFPDHHAYSPNDILSLEREVLATGAEAILCTHKDLVKVPRKELADAPLWAVAIEAQPTVGAGPLKDRLSEIARLAL